MSFSVIPNERMPKGSKKKTLYYSLMFKTTGSTSLTNVSLDSSLANDQNSTEKIILLLPSECWSSENDKMLLILEYPNWYLYFIRGLIQSIKISSDNFLLEDAFAINKSRICQKTPLLMTWLNFRTQTHNFRSKSQSRSLHYLETNIAFENNRLCFLYLKRDSSEISEKPKKVTKFDFRTTLSP